MNLFPLKEHYWYCYRLSSWSHMKNSYCCYNSVFIIIKFYYIIIMLLLVMMIGKQLTIFWSSELDNGWFTPYRVPGRSLPHCELIMSFRHQWQNSYLLCKINWCRAIGPKHSFLSDHSMSFEYLLIWKCKKKLSARSSFTTKIMLKPVYKKFNLMFNLSVWPTWSQIISACTLTSHC